MLAFLFARTVLVMRLLGCQVTVLVMTVLRQSDALEAVEGAASFFLHALLQVEFGDHTLSELDAAVFLALLHVACGRGSCQSKDT